MRTNPVVTLVAATVLLFPATKAPAQRGATVRDACSLLTQAEVAGALGVPVSAAKHLFPNVTTSCGWSEPGKAVHEAKGVVATTEPPEWFANAKQPAAGITKTPVSGLGDDALYVTTPGIGTGLNVKKGNLVFMLRVYGFAEAQVEAKEKALALRVLAKP